jgi:hypothetical protein
VQGDFMQKIVTSVITKDEFINTMKKLEKKYKETEKMFDMLYTCVCDCDKAYELTFSLFDDVVEQLQERLGDGGADGMGWISWFVWDDLWGTNNMEVSYDGCTYEVGDYETLWKVITDLGDSGKVL